MSTKPTILNKNVLSEGLRQELAAEVAKMVRPLMSPHGCQHTEGYTIILGNSPRLSIHVCNLMCGHYIPVDGNAFKEMLDRKRVRKTITLSPPDGDKLRKEGHD